MNNQRRKTLRATVANIKHAITDVESVRDTEQDCLMNMPENLQASDRYTAMEDAVENLEDAIGNLESAVENIESAIDG